MNFLHEYSKNSIFDATLVSTTPPSQQNTHKNSSFRYFKLGWPVPPHVRIDWNQKYDNDDELNWFDFKLDNLIALFDHMLHHNQIYSSYKYVKDDELPEITKSTTETNPSKSDL